MMQMSFFAQCAKWVAVFFAVLLALVLTGCSTVLPEGMENHIIAANYLGEPAFFDTVDAEGNVILDAKTVTLPEHLKRMKAQMEKSGRKKIMIYCFGGMNSFEETIRASAKLTEAIAEDRPDIYPIFVNWDSELFGCYLEDLMYIRQGIVSRWWGPITAPFLLTKNILESFGRLPMDMYYQAAGFSCFNMSETIVAVYEALRPQKTNISWYMGEDLSEHKRPILTRFGYLAGMPARVFTNALINVFGARGWKEMRRRSRLGFVKDPDTSSVAEYAVSMFTAKQDGVFSDFAKMLLEYAQEHPDTEITLIGHCMGAIIATEFLSRYPDIPFKNIVFLAGAASVQETAAAVRPFLRRHPKAHFYNLCLHPWVDWYDMMDYMVLPCGSVLTWVNDHLTEPVSREEYTVGMWGPSIVYLPRMLRGVERQVTLKAFGINDPVTNVGEDMMPRQHTDFSSPKIRFWREEFWEVPMFARRYK